MSPRRCDSDAAPDITGLVCTGRPIPEGLTCVVQDPAAASSCGGTGGIVFDGSQCVAARGRECVEPPGAFSSLEECGVTCAAAGHCDILSISFPLPWGPPQFCGDAVVECPLMWVVGHGNVPSTCAVWGPFSADVYSTDLPYPEQWDVLYSLSLARDVVLAVVCSPAE